MIMPQRDNSYDELEFIILQNDIAVNILQAALNAALAEKKAIASSYHEGESREFFYATDEAVSNIETLLVMAAGRAHKARLEMRRMGKDTEIVFRDHHL